MVSTTFEVLDAMQENCTCETQNHTLHIYIYIYVYIYSYICIYIYIYIYIVIYLYIYILFFLSLYVCIYVYIYSAYILKVVWRDQFILIFIDVRGYICLYSWFFVSLRFNFLNAVDCAPVSPFLIRFWIVQLDAYQLTECEVNLSYVANGSLEPFDVRGEFL